MKSSTSFKKGHKLNLGKHRSEKTKTKLRKANRGKHFSIKTEFKKGHISIEGFKRGQIPWNKGKSGLKGENNPNWKGGISFEPYEAEFNDRLKNQIKQRDGFRCQQCFHHQDEIKGKLHIHHIDFNKKNNDPLNLISLCPTCHAQTNFNRDDWVNYFQNQLIRGI